MSDSRPATDHGPVTLPPGYAWTGSSEGWLAVWEERASELQRAGYSVVSDAPTTLTNLTGRGSMGQVALDGGALLVRRFQHGGLLRGITGGRYLGPERPFRELLLSEELRTAGFLTPRVVAARARRLSGFGWELELLTERVEGARDLGFALSEARAGRLPAGERRALLSAAGELVARMHGVGFLHADLQPANILAEAWQGKHEPMRLWLLDLDLSSWAHPLSEQERLTNLGRLWRNVERRERSLGAALSRADKARFLRAYDALRWRQLGSQLESSRGRRAILHQVGHWLDGRRRLARDPRSQ
ncbi:MAG: tRNA A-37 threonylcarbamoyl transferase component Bud32 [Planctomycetota bacterium]|jgi:tRNA A-37 threonylcarbamoyl transferase component Bud32